MSIHYLSFFSVALIVRNDNVINMCEVKFYGGDFSVSNESSSTKGVLRGLHFQKEHTQGKLVHVTHGEVFDVAVDVRPGSKTYGQWVGVTLSSEKKNMLYVPEGFAHGFLVLSDTAEFVYKCTDVYDPSAEGGIPWNDPDINVECPKA